MPDTLPKVPPKGWIALLVNNWQIAVIFWLWLDNRNIRDEIKQVSSEYRNHLQSDANAQASINARIMERQFVEGTIPFSRSVGYDTSRDSNAKATP